MAGDTGASVYLGNINAGSLRVETAQSIQQALLSRTAAGCIYKTFGPYLDIARNFVCQRFLDETDGTHLLFVDSDIAFTTTHIDRLVAHSLSLAPDPTTAHHIIGGVYYNGVFDERDAHRGLIPMAYEWGTTTHIPPLPIHRPIPYDTAQPLDHGSIRSDLQHLQLLPVAALGTGFMLIPRAVLELFAATFAAPTLYFAEQIRETVWMGEDLTFCARAEALDIPIFLARDIKVDHYKTSRF